MILIGIDPDLHKSGVAEMNNGILSEVDTYTLWDLIGRLMRYAILNAPMLARIEDANLGRSANYHGGGKMTACNVGKNMAVATILREFCEAKGIPHEMIPPAGYSNVFKDEKRFREVTGWTERTNQDARAAVAMIWNYKTK